MIQKSSVITGKQRSLLTATTTINVHYPQANNEALNPNATSNTEEDFSNTKSSCLEMILTIFLFGLSFSLILHEHKKTKWMNFQNAALTPESPPTICFH